MKRILSLIFVLTMSLIFSAAAFAASDTDRSNEVKEKRELTVEKDSDIVLDKVEVFNGNGERHVKVAHTRKANGKSEDYDLKVDIEKGTYKAIKIPSGKNQNTISAQTANYYYAYVTATTKDPAFIALNSTTLGFSWGEDTSLPYPFFYNWRSLSTWDANPSSLGTHWYLSSSSYNNDPSSHQSATATHYNYDFGLSDYATYATHYISIVPQSGGRYTYYADLTTNGEGANLLWLSVSTN